MDVRPIGDHYAGAIPGDVEQLIHATATNPDFSEQLVKQLSSSLRKMRLEFARMLAIGILVPLALIQILRLFGAHQFLASDTLAGGGTTNALLIWIVGLSYLLTCYPKWRMVHGDAYVADRLIRAMKFGLEFQADPSRRESRDDFAASVQVAASRYRLIYRRVNSVWFFSRHVRVTARRSRDHIMSIIPGLVTADATAVANINADLARLLIRCQSGYWFQTEDIARAPVTRHWTDRLRQQIADFLLDRSVQVALVAAITTLTAVLATALAGKYLN